MVTLNREQQFIVLRHIVISLRNEERHRWDDYDYLRCCADILSGFELYRKQAGLSVEDNDRQLAAH
jgi:hypothetical protein